MTLPSRRNRRTTAPNIQPPKEADRPTWRAVLRRVLWTGCFAGIGFLAIEPIGAVEPTAPRVFTPATASPIPRSHENAIVPEEPARVTVGRPAPPAVNPKHRLPESGGAWRLRWRDPGVEEGVQQASAVEVIGSPLVRPISPVRFAQNSPFEDPFGDRLGQPGVYGDAEASPDPTAPAPPGGFQPATDPLLDESLNNENGPNDVMPEETTPDDGIDNDLIAPDPLLPDSGRAAPFRSERSFPFADDSDCDRLYNQRNCCRLEQRCQIARDYLQRNKITEISLDITPRIRPDNPNLEETTKLEVLANAPSRTWRNHEGEVIAQGRLVDYLWGRLVIEDENGERVELRPQEISEDDHCFVTAFWSLPAECYLPAETFVGRSWIPMTMTWKASALCHHPLYFEEVQLERYGHTPGPIAEPIVSGAHFFMNIAVLPYRMGINPPTECQYSLGYYRPGNCAPWLLPPVPISARGALYQSGAVLGGVYLIP